jgi:hypothetical protein
VSALLKSEVFWIAFTGVATLLAACAVVVAVRQLRFEAWLRAQEIWTAKVFTQQRRTIFAFLDVNDKTGITEKTEIALEVCRKLDEFAGLIPYLPKRRALQVWSVPFAKAWALLSEIVENERKKCRWPKKWSELERFGKEALKLHPEVLQPEDTRPIPATDYSKERNDLIYLLLYPAVLAAGIVGISVRIALHYSVTDDFFLERTSLGLLLVTFFCASYISSGKPILYSAPATGFDLLEMVLMFAGFHYLGLFFPDHIEPPRAGVAYFILIILIPLDMVWLKLVRENSRRLWELRVLAVLLLAVGWVFGRRLWWITPSVAALTLLPIYLYVFTPRWYARVRNAMKLDERDLDLVG